MSSVAIVTGGTGRIGQAICLAMRATGRDVVTNYRSGDESDEPFTRRMGIKFHSWRLARGDECLAAVQHVESEFGPIDVLVNIPNRIDRGAFASMTRERWDRAIASELGGYFNMVKAVWPGMQARGFGRIVNIGSIVGRTGRADQVIEAAVRSALHGFTKSLAQEGGPAGITVNLIEPGAIDDGIDPRGKGSACVPVGRLGHVDEIARGVVFLSDAGAGYITGSTLAINGGQHMY